MLRLTLCLLAFLTSLGSSAQTATLVVKIEGLKHEEGTVFLAVYTQDTEFLGKDIYVGKKAQVEKGKAEVMIEGLPYDSYAISTFFDKNNNGILDTNFIGIPKEPYAFSNSPSNRFGPPTFDEASFHLTTPKDTILIIY